MPIMHMHQAWLCLTGFLILLWKTTNVGFHIISMYVPLYFFRQWAHLFLFIFVHRFPFLLITLDIMLLTDENTSKEIFIIPAFSDVQMEECGFKLRSERERNISVCNQIFQVLRCSCWLAFIWLLLLCSHAGLKWQWDIFSLVWMLSILSQQ